MRFIKHQNITFRVFKIVQRRAERSHRTSKNQTILGELKLAPFHICTKLPSWNSAHKVCTQGEFSDRSFGSRDTTERDLPELLSGGRRADEIFSQGRSAFSQAIWGIIVAWVYRVPRGKSHGNLSPGTKNGRLLSMSFCWPPVNGWMETRSTSKPRTATHRTKGGGGAIIQFLQPDPVYLAGIERSKQEEEQVWVKARISLGLEASDVDADVSLALLTNTPGISPNFVLQASITTCFPRCSSGCCLPFRVENVPWKMNDARRCCDLSLADLPAWNYFQVAMADDTGCTNDSLHLLLASMSFYGEL